MTNRIFGFISHLSKFLIISSNKKESRLKSINILQNSGIFNFLLIYGQNHKFKLTIPNKFKGHKNIEINIKNISNISLFPDNLKDINGHIIHVTIIRQMIIAEILNNGKLLNRFNFYLDILRQKMNATIKLHEIAKGWKNIPDLINKFNIEFIDTVRKNEMDLHLDDLITNDNISKIVTYDTTELCFLAHPPPPIPIYEQILIRPFDNKVWLVLLFSVFLVTLIWRFYGKIDRRVDSTSHFLLAVFGFFVGQSSKFKV